LGIGIGIPVLEMVLQYIDQGHRFNIFEDLGCYPFTYNTWVAYVVVVPWPLAISCISSVYSILSIRAFNKRRAQFKELLSVNSNLNSNRYFRLMCLAGTEILFTFPLSCWSIFLNATSDPIEPWKGWDDTHSDFSHVGQYPSVIWHLDKGEAISLETTRWFVILCAIVFFAFFGFADEARKNYRAAFDSVGKRVGLSTGGSFNSTFWSSTGSKSSSQNGTLPVFVHKKMSRNRGSLDSFTDVSGVGDATSFNEKSFNGELSYGAMSLADVGGALSDDMELSPTDTLGPTIPQRAVTHDKDDDLHIEISSIRHLSTVSMSRPESMSPIEVPSPVHMNSFDVV
jgi:pheromone a factor receptor